MEKIKGQDVLRESFSSLSLEFGPFADIPINPQVTNYMLNNLRPIIKPEHVIIDFDCGIGLHGLALGKKAKRIIGLDNALVHVENAKKNAAENHIKHGDFRHGANFRQVVKVFEELHYSSAETVILLHPQEGKRISESVVQQIKKYRHLVHKILLFTSQPETEAFQTLQTLMEYQNGQRCFHLSKPKIFNMFPKGQNLFYVFSLNTKKPKINK